MAPSTFVVLLALFAAASARSSHAPEPSLYFSWKDCGKDPNRPLKVYSVSVSPNPIRMPGWVTLSVDAESTATINNADLDLSIKKKFIIGTLPVPCISGVGSCTYTDLCQYADLVPGSKITCPLPPQRITVKDLKFELPDLGGVGSLVSGRFFVKAKFNDHDSKKELGCFEVDVKIKA